MEYAMKELWFARRAIGRMLAHAGAHRTLLSWRAWEDSRYGEAELRLLRYLVPPQRTAIDIGAAEGVYAFNLQKLARRCIAFEPNPESYAYLKRALPGVEIYLAAVSSVDGQAVLRVPVVNNVAYDGWGTIEPKNSLAELPAHSVREIKVPTVRADVLPLGDVGFVKIDVEGHEVPVLAGLSGVLERCLPNLLIEVSGPQRGGTLSEVRRLLDPLGYVCLRLDERGILRMLASHTELNQTTNLIFVASQEVAG
jgi:FkbM family methyltransferase